jgi:hypothetical protein
LTYHFCEEALYINHRAFFVLTKYNKHCIQGASIFIVVLGLAAAALIVIPVNADNNVDQSLEKWSEKCDKAADKDSQDAAVKADRQYDKHAPEGPLVQCTG